MFVRMFVVVLLVAAPADADPRIAEARTLVAAADRDYKLGRFEQALAAYTTAYERYPVAALLFNIAQCHRNLRAYERAVFFYEGFLRETRKDDASRSVAEDLLRETRDALAQQTAAVAAQQRAAEDAARRRAADDEARHRAEEDARRRNDEDRRLALARRAPAEVPIYRRGWFWPVVGASVVAAGTATFFLARGTTTVEPGGSLGGLDRR